MLVFPRFTRHIKVPLISPLGQSIAGLSSDLFPPQLVHIFNSVKVHPDSQQFCADISHRAASRQISQRNFFCWFCLNQVERNPPGDLPM